MRRVIRVGTRRSVLAAAQTEWVIKRLREKHPELIFETVPLLTKGDRVPDRPLAEFGGKGVFVSELEEALLSGGIDLAVHSAKDLPAVLADGLTVAAVPVREDPADVLVLRGAAGKEVAGGPGSGDAAAEGPLRIGTGSLRRQMFLREIVSLDACGEPDIGKGSAGSPVRGEPGGRAVCGEPAGRNGILCVPIRGNVPTRLEKILTGEVDAVVLAAAGLRRLGLWQNDKFRFYRLDPERFVPAGGQGTLAVEARKGEEGLDFLKELEDGDARLCLETEREVLRRLEAGCHTAVGVYAAVSAGEEMLTVFGAYGEGGGLCYARETAEKDGWRRAAERLAAKLLAESVRF